MGKLYQNDVGTRFEVNLGVDLTEATLVQLKVKKPSTEMVWDATTDDAEHGLVYYVTQDGDLSEAGTYYLCSSVEFSDGSTFTGETVTFNVYPLYG